MGVAEPDESAPSDRGGATVPRQRTGGGPSDFVLLERMRGGDSGAYDELYRRHADAVRRYARTCCRDDDTADDLTNEVFAATLQAVRGGAGPHSAVRAYLLTVVRRVAANWARSARREQLVAHFATFAVAAVEAGGPGDGETLDPGADVRAMREADRSLAMRAFRSLPERWQAVLWHTTVEEASPREVAPLLGLTPNATAVLAHRAREGLKQAYLQAHVSRALTEGGECAQYADRLGAYARGGLRARAERGLRKHLSECARCAMAASEVSDLNRHIRLVLPVAVVGWFAADSSGTGAAFLAGAGAAGAAGGGAASGVGGGAAAEGTGAPMKAGIATGVVASAAAAVLALALVGGSDPEEPRATAPERPAERPPAGETGPAPRPPAAEDQRPSPEPHLEPAPTPDPSRSPTAEPDPEPQPEREPNQEPEPTFDPPPETPPAPEPEPTPTPTPEPPPTAHSYALGELAFGLFGGGEEPEISLADSSPVWQREPLSIAGTEYAQGITVQAASSVMVELNRECPRYRAMAGVDDLTRGPGSVVFSVYGDGDELWRSAELAGGEAAVPVNVSLAGVDTLRLVTEPTDDPLAEVALADWAASEIACD